jgi:hypothetical protein
MPKKIIRLTENELTRLIKKVISEQKLTRGEMQDIIALQYDILTQELYDDTAVWIDNPSGCKKPFGTYIPYNPGVTNQCKVSGTTLCNGPCFQKKAMDGIYGPLTKAAYTKYKDSKITIDGEDKTLEQVYGGAPGDFETSDDWGAAHTEDWQIPAYMSNIKAFQYYVWGKIETDAEKQPNSCDSNGQNCSYKSILCGNNFCKKDKAMDGSWGTNTKKAWAQYKEQYFDDGYSAISKYENMPEKFT